jgi:hypothetical protein
MRKSILSVLGATMLAGSLAMASPASAEPEYDIWKCYNTRSDPFQMSKYEYYGCPLGVIRIISSSTGRVKLVLNGLCANQLWMDSGHRATYRDAMARCDY